MHELKLHASTARSPFLARASHNYLEQTHTEIDRLLKKTEDKKTMSTKTEP
jgi:hypothetical protein